MEVQENQEPGNLQRSLRRTFRMVAASTLAVHAGLEEKIGVGEREAAVPRCLGTRLFQGRTPDPEPKALHWSFFYPC